MRLPRNKSKHHRKPKCRNGSNNKNNISIVTKKAHRAYHLLFDHGNPHHIAHILNDIWINPRYKLGVVER